MNLRTILIQNISVIGFTIFEHPLNPLCGGSLPDSFLYQSSSEHQAMERTVVWVKKVRLLIFLSNLKLFLELN